MSETSYNSSYENSNYTSDSDGFNPYSYSPEKPLPKIERRCFRPNTAGASSLNFVSSELSDLTDRSIDQSDQLIKRVFSDPEQTPAQLLESMVLARKLKRSRSEMEGVPKRKAVPVKEKTIRVKKVRAKRANPTRNFFLTIWDIAMLAHLKAIASQTFKYLTISVLEVCPDTYKEHHHAYFQCKSRTRCSALLKLLQRNKYHFNLKVSTSAPESAVAYCTPMWRSKERKQFKWEYTTRSGDPKEESYIFGTLSGQGKRTDWDQVRRMCEAGVSMLDITKAFPKLAIQNRTHILSLLEEYRKANQKAPTVLTDVNMYPWQRSLIDEASAPAGARKVVWINDPVGNTGKSALRNYMFNQKETFIVDSGKYSDVAYQYNCEPIIIFDLPRTTEGYVPYRVMEKLKDGLISSTKYHSTTKAFPHPHIYVFANFAPDFAALSRDRWDYRTIDAEKEFVALAIPEIVPFNQSAMVAAERPSILQENPLMMLGLKRQRRNHR